MTSAKPTFDPAESFRPDEPLRVAFTMAIRGLKANRIRSLLTMLGVIIGVGAVIIAIGIGEGSRESMMQRVQRLGTNVLTIRSGQRSRGGVGFGFGSFQTLTPADAEGLRAAPAIGQVAPEVRSYSQVKYGNRNTRVPILGTDTRYPDISNHRVASGRFFSRAESDGKKRVAVLGSTTAQTLFGDKPPMGETIRVAGQTFQVTGVLSEKGSMGPESPDDRVYIPYTTAMSRLLGVRYLNTIQVQARSFDEMKTAQQQAERILRTRHGLASGAEADFQVFNQADLAAMQTAQQDTFASLITALAVVSLAVGGIGIMNIMLVSVTERTREIGIRKAIGARRRDVLYQFLLEAMFLALAGGAIGILAGVSGSYLVGKANEWDVLVNFGAIAIAFGFSALVGVFFGFYPALKASKMRPVEALRYE